MPQNGKKTPLDPSMGVITRNIDEAVGRSVLSKPKKPKMPRPRRTETRPFYSPSRFVDEVGESLSGLKYLNPANRPRR